MFSFLLSATLACVDCGVILWLWRVQNFCKKIVRESKWMSFILYLASNPYGRLPGSETVLSFKITLQALAFIL